MRNVAIRALNKATVLMQRMEPGGLVPAKTGFLLGKQR
jgi:hypothetical protein